MFITEIGKYHYEDDDQVKAKYATILFNETVPFYLDKLDAQAKKNNGYLAAGRVSVLATL